MVTKLSVGYAQAITEDIVYALPAKTVRVQSNAAVEVSNEVGFTTADTLTNADTVGAETSARFIRCTTAGTVVSITSM